MTRRGALLLLSLGVILALRVPAEAETRTLSWGAVTTYSDGSPIGSETTVSYTAYWTTDPGLSIASLRVIGASLAPTSVAFDPDGQGMTRGQTVCFTVKTVLGSGAESALAPAYAWTVPPLPPVSPPALSSLSVSGPSSVNEGGSATYAATATYADGTSRSVTPSWGENSSYATISAGGVLTASAVTGNQSVTVSASYTENGVTRTASQAVTIADAPTAPAAPRNVNLGGPLTPPPTELWEVSWDAVTTYADGSPIETGASVQYAAYWTTDPSLSPGTLRALGSSAPTTKATFDPAAEGMAKNTRVYFTTRALLGGGSQSSLAEPVSWRVSNKGPNAPANGRIFKK